MSYSDEVISTLGGVDIPKEELPDIDTYILSFGKHKGEKLTDVAHTDPSYILVGRREGNKRPLRTLLTKI